MMSHFMMPPKMLTKIPFTLGSAGMILNAAVTFSAVAPPPTSRKFAGSPPKCLMMSIVRHRQAGAVDQAADVAVERDVAEVVALGLDLDRVLLVEVAQRLALLVAVERVVVEVHLASSATTRPSVSTTSGLISTSDASFSTNALVERA